jgi:hypothetical protein
MTMYVYCVYPAMSKKSENLSDINKKDASTNCGKSLREISKMKYIGISRTTIFGFANSKKKKLMPTDPRHVTVNTHIFFWASILPNITSPNL